MNVTKISKIIAESLNLTESEVVSLDVWTPIAEQHPFDALDVVELCKKFAEIDPRIKIEMFSDLDDGGDEDGFMYNQLTVCKLIEIAMPELFEKFTVADVVRVHNDSGFVLRCATQMYDTAIVLSVEPLVLASMCGNMRWSATVSQRDFEFVRKASAGEYDRVSRRLRG